MRTLYNLLLTFVIVFGSLGACASANGGIKTGAEQTEKYLPLLQGKRIAIVANQTSRIGKTILVDSLKVFGGEYR